MEPESSLVCSQKPNTGPYHEPAESTIRSISLRSILIISSHIPLSPKWSLPFRFSGQIPVCIVLLFCACYVSPHPIILHLIVLVKQTEILYRKGVV